MRVWDFCIARPVFTTVFIVTMLAFGALGYTRMGIDLYPRIEPPIVNVTTVLQGASPEVMDQDVTQVIEEQVGTLEGVDVITSSSLESRSNITIQFNLDRDIDVAAQEVRDRVGVASIRLPTDVEPPIIQKIDPAAQPIMWLSIAGNGPYSDLSYYAEKVVKPRLESLPGVGGVQLGGYQEKAVRVWVDPDRMRGFQLGPADVVRALQSWQVELPGGRIETPVNESTIKVEGEYKTVRGLSNLVVAYQNGASVRLRDLGSVEEGLEDVRGLARFNGKQSVGLGVKKQSGGNTVEVARVVKEALPEIQKQLPDWVQINYAFDASIFIEKSIAGVQFDVLFGAIFTCVVIGLFLRDWRSTLISVLAIPTSLISYFFLADQLGFTINQMSMLGMSLAVGLVIDDAIVVIESIHRRLARGDDPVQAASQGTREVAFAVIAATISIAAIFVPVAFIGGVVGQFFLQFGLSVAVTIGLSLVVSLTLTPMLASRLMKPEEHEGWLGRALAWPVDTLERIYR
ncbi:MAG: efflux RND transporter permease subunit, partial [Candidatus Eremiobacterota bacterium]